MPILYNIANSSTSQSRALKSDMLWKKYKLYLLIFVVVILVAFFLSLAICGANYDKCKKHK